jgi:nucleotide-binding universal stress UspA family protein
MRRRDVPSGWNRILVATDFSRNAQVALRSAEALARETGAEIALVHVVDIPSASYAFGVEMIGLPDLRETWAKDARRRLRSTAQRARARGVRFADTEVLIGTPWYEIVEAARRHKADLVILGNSGRSRFQRLLLGSTAENVVRHSSVPVLVTRSRPLSGLRRVLVPVSFDEGSRLALEYAARRIPRRVQVEAFHAVPSTPLAEPWVPIPLPSIPEATRELRAFVDAATTRRVVAKVERAADAAAAILGRARTWKADLILLCTHGRGGLAHVLLGSVAEKVARYADRPVLVLPPPDRMRAVEPSPPRRAKRRKSVAPMAAGQLQSRPLGRKRPGPWTGQAHTGRGGPEGRRGVGSQAGAKTHRG